MYEEIYLENDEEVTSAIEKIKKSKKRAIALCLPHHSQLGQSIVNLKLIFKEARADGKEVGLVSPDTSIRNLAERVGFSVFSSAKEIDFSNVLENVKPKGKKVLSAKMDPLQSKEKPGLANDNPDETSSQDKNEDWVPTDPSGPNGDLKTAGFTSQSVSGTAWGEDMHADSEEQEEKEAEPNDNQKTNSSHEDHKHTGDTHPLGGVIPTRGNLRLFRKKKRAIWFPILSVFLVLLGASIAAALIIPKSTVKITVFAQPFNETVKSSVDTQITSVESDKATIPGKVLTMDHTSKSSTKATGKKDLGEKAHGTVTLFNEWDSATHTFAAGTKLRASNGSEFVLNEAVSVPGATSSVVAGSSVIVAGKKDASVTANSAGESFNINPTTFTIPTLPKAQQEKIYATSSASFTGGTSRVVTVVTQNDIDIVIASVKKLNVEEAAKKLKEQAGEAIVLDAAVQTVAQNATTSAPVDAETESIEGSITGSFRVIAFSESDQNQLLEKLLENKIPAGQKIVSQGAGLDIDLSQFELNLVSDTRLELTNNLKAFTVTRFDENKIRRDLIGTKKSDIRSEIEKNNVPLDTVESTVTPTWWPRMPLNGSKIKLEISYKEKPATAEKPPES